MQHLGISIKPLYFITVTMTYSSVKTTVKSEMFIYLSNGRSYVIFPLASQYKLTVQLSPVCFEPHGSVVGSVASVAGPFLGQGQHRVGNCWMGTFPVCRGGVGDSHVLTSAWTWPQLPYVPLASFALQVLQLSPIVSSVKCNFCKLVLLRMIECIDKKEVSRVNLLNAVRFVHNAWERIIEKTIRNCFPHAGIIQKSNAS